MQVTNIEVTVSRKRQPAQYEEGHVGTRLNAIVEPGESYATVLGTLLDTAQFYVSRRLGLDHEGKPLFGSTIATVTVTNAATGEKVTTTAPLAEPKADKKGKGEKSAAERGQIATNPENRVDPAATKSEIPSAPATQTPTPPPAAASAPEIPATPATPAPAPGTDEVTAEALSAYISSQARSKQQGGKGFTVPEVKALQKQFGVERLADLKPEQRGPFKLALEKIVA